MLAKPLTSNTCMEQLSLIKHCADIKMTPTETYDFPSRENIKVKFSLAKTMLHPTGARKLCPTYISFDFNRSITHCIVRTQVRLILLFQMRLARNQHENLHDLKMSVRSKIASYEKEWYGHIYKQWVQRDWKCVCENGEYFEKCVWHQSALWCVKCLLLFVILMLFEVPILNLVQGFIINV